MMRRLLDFATGYPCYHSFAYALTIFHQKSPRKRLLTRTSNSPNASNNLVTFVKKGDDVAGITGDGEGNGAAREDDLKKYAENFSDVASDHKGDGHSEKAKINPIMIRTTCPILRTDTNCKVFDTETSVLGEQLTSFGMMYQSLGNLNEMSFLSSSIHSMILVRCSRFPSPVAIIRQRPSISI